jgi:ribosome-associated protein
MDVATGRGILIMRDVLIRDEPVELYKILKFEGMVPSGGVAKLAIESGDVMVNDEIETRKRKKIVAGDIIEFNGDVIRIVIDDSRSTSTI